MRWPLRRGDKGSGAQHAAPAPLSTVPSTAPAPSTTPDPGWSALPPIAPTWAAQSPLTTATQPARLPLTQRPTAPPAPRSVRDGAPEPGRVIGLAAVVPPAPLAEHPDRAPLPAYFNQQPPLRHVAARPIVEHAPLTAATDSYVGQPMAPAPPPTMAQTAQTFYEQQNAERAQAAKFTATTDAGARFQEALANLHKSGLPTYVPGGEAPPAEPAAPPQAPAPDPSRTSLPMMPASGADRPNFTHRRNSLAQSRRLGLGAPIRRDTDDAGDEPSDSEPARGHAAPPPPTLIHPAAITPAPPEGGEPAGPAAAPPAAAPEQSTPAPAPPSPAAPPASAAPPTSATSLPSSVPSSGQDSDDGPDGEPPRRIREVIKPIVVLARPIADGTQRPGASAAPLVFRAGARRTETTYSPPAVKAPERAVVTRAPAELAQALRASHGIDVADVPVHRDTEASTEARGHRARAFTRGGRVFLPEEVGALTSAEARGLLAHELVHAAQQRRLGGALPEEDSPEGRALEAEAVAAERQYTHTPTVMADDIPLVHTPPPVTANWVDRRIVQRAGPAIDYFADNANLSGTQEEHFKEASTEAVRQVMKDYEDRHPGQTPPSGSGSPFSGTSEQEVAERQFLDVINSELDRLGEPRQDSLSEEDKQKVADMLGKGAGGAGGTQYKESSQASRWQEEHFGSANAFGADIGGLLALTGWGQTDRVDEVDAQGNVIQKDAQGNPITPGGSGAGRTPTPGAGPQIDHESSRFSRFQEQHFGSGNAFGADIGGIAALFSGGQIDQRPPATSPTGTGHGSGHGAGQGAGQGGAPGSTPSSDLHTSHATQRFRSGTSASDETAGEFGEDGASGLDGIDMDELALRIYDRLRSRLRRELLVDRERAGLLTDFR